MSLRSAMLTVAAVSFVAFIGSALINSKSTTSVLIEEPQINVGKPVAKLPVKSVEVKNIEVDPEQILVLNTPVFNDSVEMLISQIERLGDSYSDLYLVIDSPGGSVIDGARLISFMQGNRTRINTVCYSICASMAAIIHQYGAKRLMVDRSVLMFHPASGTFGGNLDEVQSDLTFVTELVDGMNAFVANRAGVDFNQFKSRLAPRLWVTASTALKTNFSDGNVLIHVNGTLEKSFNLQEKLKAKNIAIPISYKKVFTPQSIK